MVGQAVLAEADARGLGPVGAARSGTDIKLDLSSGDGVKAAFDRLAPSIVVNCAAEVDLVACERDPGAAYMINSRAVAILAAATTRVGARLVQVSTDQFFSGDGDDPHPEGAPVTLLNEYARTKLAGEAFALAVPNSLVVRTNVTGYRAEELRPTFIEWAIAAIERQDQLTLFDDYYTSTLDAGNLAAAAFDLLEAGTSGLINVASSEVSNKLTFIRALAERLGTPLSSPSVGSIRDLEPPRAESTGLDVSKAERMLGRPLPDLNGVIDTLVAEYRHAS